MYLAMVSNGRNDIEVYVANYKLAVRFKDIVALEE